MNSKLLSWFIGGLNFQIEHHLFPNICHVHYKKLSKIVQSTAKDFGIPYNSYKNMFSAVHNYKFLKHLGSFKNSITYEQNIMLSFNYFYLLKI